MENFVIEGTTLLAYKGKGEKHVVIPNGIRKIGDGAFKGSDIETLSFEDQSLSIIGKSAFENCYNLMEFSVPFGVTEIGDNAFLGCEKLRYVYIPGAVNYFGNQLFSSNTKTVIVGTGISTKAKEYAERNKILYRDNFSQVKSNFQRLDVNRGTQKVEHFNIYGEKVDVSNTFITYKGILDYYNDLKTNALTEIEASTPKDADDCKKLTDSAQKNLALFDKTRERLERQGIYLQDGNMSNEVFNSIVQQGKIITTFMNYRNDAVNSSISEIKQFSSNAYQEAANNATGLSYGILTSSTSQAIAYEIDNFIQTQKQLKKYNAQAKAATDKFTNQQIEAVNKAVHNAALKVVPEYKREVGNFIDELCSFELDKLGEEGIIDLKTNEKTDLKKSDYYLSLASGDSRDQKYNIAMALYYNPLNVDAYKLVAFRDIIDDEVVNLSKYVGQGTVIPNEVHKQIIGMINDGRSFGLIRSEVEKNKEFIPDYIVNQIMRSLSEKKEKEIIEVSQKNPEADMDIQSYCEKELEGIISENDIQYLHRFVLPSNTIGGEWDHERVVNAMISIRKKEVDKQETLNKIKASIKDADTMEDYLRIKASANSIKGFKDSDEYLKEVEDLIKKEEEYLKLTELAKDETSGETDLTAIIDAFEALGDYKDSVQIKGGCQNRLDEIVGARKRKRNKLIITVGSIVIACVAAVFLITNVISPAVKHNKAMKLIEAGDYDAAYAILLELGDENAVENNLNARADELLQKGQYEEAYALYSKAGNEKAIKSSKKERGEKLLKEEKFDEAYKLLEEAGETELVKQSKKERGLVLLDSGDYDAAYLLLKAAGADDIIHDSLVSRADSLIAEGNYDDAYSLLLKAGETGIVHDSVKSRSIAMILDGNRSNAESLMSKYSINIDNDILQAIIKASKTMDTVVFGNYKQDKDGKIASGIEWLVLEVQNDKALLVSRKALDAKTFINTKNGYNSYEKMWADSIIREWLNEDFYSEAFNDEESKMILKANISSNAMYYEGANKKTSITTEDSVFLLSEDEVLKYMPNNKDRVVDATEYANSQYSNHYKSSNHHYWWLRNEWFEPEGTSSGKYIRMVNEDGELKVENLIYYESDDKWYVRPAIWVSLG